MSSTRLSLTKVAPVAVLLAICLAGGATQSLQAAEAPAATVVLKDAAVVSGRNMTLGEVAKISSANARFVALLRSVNLGTSPWPGQVFKIDTGEVRLRLRFAQIDPDSIHMVDGQVVKVSRASQSVPGAEIADTAKTAALAAWQDAERVECDVLQHPQDVVVQAGKMQLIPQTPPNPQPGIMTVLVEIQVDGKRVRSVAVPVRVRVFKSVVVTSQALALGETIQPSDLTVVQRDMGSSTDMITDVSAAAGQQTVRPIAAGSVLRQSDVKVVPLVHRNASVIVIATAGSVTIRANGTALEDGQMGQLVKVRPDYSRDSISAKVIGDGQVEIDL